MIKPQFEKSFVSSPLYTCPLIINSSSLSKHFVLPSLPFSKLEELFMFFVDLWEIFLQPYSRGSFIQRTKYVLFPGKNNFDHKYLYTFSPPFLPESIWTRASKTWLPQTGFYTNPSQSSTLLCLDWLVLLYSLWFIWVSACRACQW